MKLYFIAGEASGDLHASNLIKALKSHDQSLQCRGWGGDLMSEAGCQVVKHYRDLAFMGFIEVIMNLRTILGNIRSCKEDISNFKPDGVVLIDYPGFNLRIATWCREQGIPVYYYISPQAWAWKEGRVKRIKKDVTRMLTILPFEVDFYKKHQMDVDFVGHPLLDVVKNLDRDAARASLGLSPEDRVLALLPGSRKQEISTMLPVMSEVAKNFPTYKVIIAGAPGQDPSFYQSLPSAQGIDIVFGKTYDLFASAEAGLVTSGTATLEAALHGLPQAVCYKGNTISYLIARQLVKIKYISLVNLVMDREVVRELIQGDMNVKSVSKELDRLLNDEEYQQKQKNAYVEMQEMLGGMGASQRAAQIVIEDLATRKC